MSDPFRRRFHRFLLQPWILITVIFLFLACGCQDVSPGVGGSLPGTPSATLGPTAAPTLPPATAAPTALPPPPAPKKILRLAWEGGEVRTLDSSLAEDWISNQVIEQTTAALIRQNEESGQIEPGMITHMEVNPEGTIFRFDMVQNIPWVRYTALPQGGGTVAPVRDCGGNIRTVTSDDFLYSLRRSLQFSTNSPRASLLMGILNAQDFRNKKADLAAVDIKALDRKTLQITLAEAGIYNLTVLATTLLRAQPEWLIQGDRCASGQGERWSLPAFYPSYGPYALKSWTRGAITLIKNPFWPGAGGIPQAQIDEVSWSMLDTATSLQRFQAGELEMTSIPYQVLPAVLSNPAARDRMSFIQMPGVEFLYFNTRALPTQDKRVRLALSLAIDRDTLAAQAVPYGEPAGWFTPSGMVGAPRPENAASVGVRYDPERARLLLADYLSAYRIPQGALRLSLGYPSSKANRTLVESIARMWETNLNIRVTLNELDWESYNKNRLSGPANLYLTNWLPEYPDAKDFVERTFGENGMYAATFNWENGQQQINFQQMLEQAKIELSPTRRIALYESVENVITQEQAVAIPLYWFRTQVLIQPYVQFSRSLMGYDHFEKWDINR